MRNPFSKPKNDETPAAPGALTVAELVQRFPEIPKDLHTEPVLARFAATFGFLLRQAQDPSACSQQYSAGNYYYLKLVGPMKIHMYGLSTREKALQQLQEMLQQYERDPEGFVASLVPADAGEHEVRGPGCA